MHYWQFTLFFLSTYSLVNAGSANRNQSCDPKNNKLQAGSFQFFSDCNSVNFCLGANNTCQPKGCRKDDFPFGYNDPSTFPPKCPRGTFCPDEADACVPWQPVGFPCQLNRDDQCEAPPNFDELADTTHKGLNFNGSVCLHNICMWANVTEGDACIVENTGYTAYSPSGEFIDIVSRHNCRTGFYCDSIQLICIKNKLTGEACDADKECETYNCLTNNVCGVSADTAHHFSIGIYAGVGVAILGGMFATLFGLFFLHRRHRDQEREKRVQYWREQNAFHQNLLQMRETARASVHTLPGDRHDGYSDEAHAPIMHGGASKGSGLRYMSDEGSEYDEAYIMQQPPQRPADMGRF